MKDVSVIIDNDSIFVDGKELSDNVAKDVSIEKIGDLWAIDIRLYCTNFIAHTDIEEVESAGEWKKFKLKNK